MPVTLAVLLGAPLLGCGIEIPPSYYCQGTQGGVDVFQSDYLGDTQQAAETACETEMCRSADYRCSCGADDTEALVGTWVGTETLTLTMPSTGEETTTNSTLTLVVDRTGYNGLSLHGFCAQWGTSSPGNDSVPVNLIGN